MEALAKSRGDRLLELGALTEIIKSYSLEHFYKTVCEHILRRRVYDGDTFSLDFLSKPVIMNIDMS